MAVSAPMARMAGVRRDIATGLSVRSHVGSCVASGETSPGTRQCRRLDRPLTVAGPCWAGVESPPDGHRPGPVVPVFAAASEGRLAAQRPDRRGYVDVLPQVGCRQGGVVHLALRHDTGPGRSGDVVVLVLWPACRDLQGPVLER